MKTISFKPTPKTIDFRHRFLHTIYPHRFTKFLQKFLTIFTKGSQKITKLLLKSIFLREGRTLRMKVEQTEKTSTNKV